MSYRRSRGWLNECKRRILALEPGSYKRECVVKNSLTWIDVKKFANLHYLGLKIHTKDSNTVYEAWRFIRNFGKDQNTVIIWETDYFFENIDVYSTSKNDLMKLKLSWKY